MLLEQWAYNSRVLEQISGHYSAEHSKPMSTTKESLPPELVTSLVRAKHVMDGVNWTRFIGMALFDLVAHSSAPPYAWGERENLSLRELFDVIMLEIADQNPEDLGAGAYYAASWYHLCTGYDAGYYSYLWSEVFAVDVFAAWSEAAASDQPAGSGAETRAVGCFNSAIGWRYRRTILSPGATKPGMTMLRDFLGRDPGIAAWINAAAPGSEG